jgi:hypothetical protein
MAIVLAYWGRLRGEIEQLFSCGEDVFSPDHPSYSRFFLLVSLAVARLMFLEHTMRFFVTRRTSTGGSCGGTRAVVGEPPVPGAFGVRGAV